MRVKPLLLAIVLALPAVAAWPRLVITQKGDWVDKPEAHNLNYFTEYPSLRDEGGDFCYLCTPEKRLAEAKKTQARAEVRPVGQFNGFTASDVFYYFGGDEKPAWKATIVQTGLDSYQEIYHDQPNEGQPNPSFGVKAGTDQLLCVVDNVYRSDSEEECFWFGADGAVRLDFTPIWKAAQNAAPAGRRIWGYGLKAKETFDHMTLAVGIRYEESSRCCDHGVVNVGFELDQWRIRVIRTEFDPDQEYGLAIPRRNN